jgi:heme/copper-type cytochrome/quinol oxidase subunit 3
MLLSWIYICIALLASCIAFDDSLTLSSGEKNAFAIVLLIAMILAAAFVGLQTIKVVLIQVESLKQKQSQDEVKTKFRVESTFQASESIPTIKSF